MHSVTKALVCCAGVGWSVAYGSTVELITGISGQPVGGEILDVSADGRFVLFVSGSARLVSGDTNKLVDVLLRDRTSGTTVRVNVSSDGVQANDTTWGSSGGAVTPDGRYAAFATAASNLVPGDITGHPYTDVHS